MTILIPISKRRALLKEAKSNGITITDVRTNVYSLECTDNPQKVQVFKKLWGLMEV